MLEEGGGLFSSEVHGFIVGDDLLVMNHASALDEGVSEHCSLNNSIYYVRIMEDKWSSKYRWTN